MFDRTPVAAALLAVFAAVGAGHAAPARAQTSGIAQARDDGPAADAAPVAATLPAVTVRDTTDRNDYLAERSSVGAKVPTSLRDIPQSTAVVDHALMQSQGAASFQDALRNVPGITIGGAEGGQIGNNVNLRGFTARTDIYLDGFRDRGQYYRDTFDLESIDVLYGPSSMLFGRGSTGGVVNQVSKQARLKPSAEVSGTIGTGDRYRSTVDANRPLSDTAALRINAFGQDVGSTRDVMKNKDYGIAPTVRFGIGTPTEITLSALIQHNDDMPDYGILPLNGHPAPVPPNTFYGLTSDRTIQDVQIGTARIEHKFSPALTLTNQTRLAHYATDARETSPGSILTGPTAGSPALSSGNYTSLPLSQLYVKLASHDRVINDHSVYNDTNVRYRVATGGLRHDLIAGAEIGRDTYTNQSYARGNLPIVPLLSPPYLTNPPGVTTTAGNLANASANSFAAYANDTVSVGEHWKVVGGLRWDRFQAEIANTVSTPAFAAQTNYFTSMRGGLIYQPTEAQSYYASYGTSFDPSLETLTLTNNTQNLAPEQTHSYEIGGKWNVFGDRLSVTSALFRQQKTNARTQLPDGTYALAGNVRIDGLQAGASGKLTDKWKVFAGYTYMDARIVAAQDGTQGNVPANTPRHTATLWSTYEPAPHWEAGGGATYMSARYAANNNLVQVGGYIRWDAMVAYHQPRYDLQLNLWNLTDKRYYDALIPSDGGRAVPGIGRTLLASATYRF